MTASTVNVRPAAREDVPAILDIYNQAVIHTTASYDLEPVTLESRVAWFEDKTQSGWPVWVAEAQGKVIGWATYGPFRAKAGYDLTAEHSVYVRDGIRGKGVGRQLMTVLIDDARKRGLHVLIGGVDADNAGSIAFHESLGFESGVRLREVGRKFDRWLDVLFMQLFLDRHA